MIDLRLYLTPQQFHRLLTRPLPKLPRYLWPHGIEREYYRRLLAVIDTMQTKTEELFIPHLPRLFREASAGRRMDSYPEELQQLVQTLSLSLDRPFGEAEIMALDIGQKTSKWNNVQWQETLRKLLGVNLFQSEPWLLDDLRGFAQTNAGLIKSIKSQYLESVQQGAMQALQSGQRWEQFAKTMQAGEFTEKYIGRAKSRAELIAVDQIGKLNGNLTQMRQTQVGITEYVWVTSRDERVRPTHRSFEGKTFSWAVGSPEGHPGQPCRCRCHAAPVIQPLIAAAA